MSLARAIAGESSAIPRPYLDPKPADSPPRWAIERDFLTEWGSRGFDRIGGERRGEGEL